MNEPNIWSLCSKKPVWVAVAVAGFLTRETSKFFICCADFFNILPSHLGMNGMV